MISLMKKNKNDNILSNKTNGDILQLTNSSEKG